MKTHIGVEVMQGIMGDAKELRPNTRYLLVG